MTTVAKDQTRRVLRLTPFAEIVQTFVASPLSEGEQAACMSFDEVVALRVRRVLALLGRELGSFQLSELAAALSVDKSRISRDLADVEVALGDTARRLGFEMKGLIPTRRETAAAAPEPSDEEELQAEFDRPLPSGSRSDRMRRLRRDSDAV